MIENTLIPTLSSVLGGLIAGTIVTAYDREKSILLNGITNPISTQGNNGDFYINTTSSTIFGPKTNGVWPIGKSLIGPIGPIGPSPKEYRSTAGFILTNNYTLTINTQGVPELFEPPLGDVIIGELGTDFDDYVNIGRMDYIGPDAKVYLVSLNLKVQTTNPTSYDIVKVEFLYDGSPLNGGLAETTGYADKDYPTNISMALAGSPISSGHYFSLRITNLTSNNALIFYPPSQFGGFSYTLIDI